MQCDRACVRSCSFKWAVCALLLGAAKCQTIPSFFARQNLLIAHRGSPCSFPDETLPGYRDAARHEMDYLEMDVIASKDGQLMLRHSVTLDTGTNIQDLTGPGGMYEGRNASRAILPDEAETGGHFLSDFTAEELKGLTMQQSFEFRDHSVDSLGIGMATLADVFELYKELRANGTDIGLYIEMKDPWYHEQQGFDLPSMLLAALQASGISGEDMSEYFAVQSFDYATLAMFSAAMKGADLDLPLVWLVDCSERLPGDAKLQQLAALATQTAVGPDKYMLLAMEGTPECGMDTVGPVCEMGLGGRHDGAVCAGRLIGGDAQLLSDTPSAGQAFVIAAHKAGVLVHVWTIRNEDRFMAIDFRSDALAEMDVVMAGAGLNADGAFVDCPASALEWRNSLPTRMRNALTTAELVNEDADYQVTSRSAAIVFAILIVLTIACVVTAYISYRRQKEYEMLNGPAGSQHAGQSSHGVQLAGGAGPTSDANTSRKAGSPLRTGPLSTDWDPGEQAGRNGFQNVSL